MRRSIIRQFSVAQKTAAGCPSQAFLPSDQITVRRGTSFTQSHLWPIANCPLVLSGKEGKVSLCHVKSKKLSHERENSEFLGTSRIIFPLHLRRRCDNIFTWPLCKDIVPLCKFIYFYTKAHRHNCFFCLRASARQVHDKCTVSIRCPIFAVLP